MNISKEQMSQLVLMLCCAALIGSWVAEYVFGLQACVLCIYQRYLYIATTLILALNLFLFSGQRPNAFLIGSSLVLLSCASLAAYQVAIENQWVPLPDVCTAPAFTGSFEDFKAMVASKPYVSCDQVSWSLFGISMAGYNFLYALFLSICAFIGVFVHDKKKKKFTRR